MAGRCWTLAGKVATSALALLIVLSAPSALSLEEQEFVNAATTPDEEDDLFGTAQTQPAYVEPQTSIYNNYQWLAYENFDLPNSNVNDAEAMEATDLNTVFQRAIDQGYEGFTISDGWAFFKETQMPITKEDLVYTGGEYPVTFYIKGPRVELQGSQESPPSSPAGQVIPVVAGDQNFQGDAATAAAEAATEAAEAASRAAEAARAAMQAEANQQKQMQQQQPQQQQPQPQQQQPQPQQQPQQQQPEASQSGGITVGTASVIGSTDPTLVTGTSPSSSTSSTLDENWTFDSVQIVIHVSILSLGIFAYSIFMRSVVKGFKDSEETVEVGDGQNWLEVEGDSPPILTMLDQMRPPERLEGAAVKQALRYSSLLDLLVSTPNMVFEDPSQRAPLSHSDLASFVRGLDFTEIGLGPGDRMACLVPNGAEAAVLLLCCFAKCTVVPLNPTSTQQELVTDAGRVRAKVLVAHCDYLENTKQQGELMAAAAELNIGIFSLTPLEKACGRFSWKHVPGTAVPARTKTRRFLSVPDDTSLVLFTSGTSGSKKCVPYTLNTLVIGSANIIASWELRPSDRVCNMMPLFHVGGITRNVLSVVLSGGSAVLCGAFDPILFWDIVESRRTAVTWYYAGPVMHQLILDEFKARGMSSYRFRFIANAAGGLLPSLAVQMRSAYHCTILPGYGMTECMPISAPPLSYKLDREGTSGRRVGPELKIFDDDGKEVPSGSLGNIVVRGPPTFEGYEGDPQATKDAFFHGEWFNTGDLGWMDKDGYLYITGRSKEVINRGGEIISPFEIEEALQAHDKVKACIAFSVPHDVLDEGIGIAVVPEEGLPKPSLRSLQSFSKQTLTFAKWPQVLVLMSDLPKNHANKPLRVKLADRLSLTSFWGGAMTDGMSEVSRTFLAGCPEKGASLKSPIPDVSQVKVDVDSVARRIEAIGKDLQVAEAAVAQVGNDKRLCACVTPDTVDTAALTELMKEAWDEWEIPVVCVAISSMPRAAGSSSEVNNVDPARLVRLLEVIDPDYVGPTSEIEERVQRIWEEALDKPRISVDADFFELGGTSLLVGPLALSIQDELQVVFTAVDIFSSPTIRSVADLVETRIQSGKTNGKPEGSPPNLSNASSAASLQAFIPDMAVSTELPLGNTHPLVLFVQAIPFFVWQPLYRLTSWIVFVYLFVTISSFFASRNLVSIVSTIVLARLLMSIVSPIVFIIAKWTVVGQYQEGQHPLFGTTYLRWWFVNQLSHILTKGVFKYHLPLYYRLLGARIGAGVKIELDVKISEFDLVRIGAHSALDRCILRPFSMNTNGCYSLRRIVLGEECTIAAKTVIAGGASLNGQTCLGPNSSSHELQDSRPENRLSCMVLRASPPFWLQVSVGWPILFLQKVVAFTPLLILMQQMKTNAWYDGTLESLQDGLHYITNPQRLGYYLSFMLLRRLCSPVLALAYAIVIKRWLIGTFTATPDDQEPDRSDWEIFRSWLLGRLIPDAHLCGVQPLLGRHYECISMIYRLLGVKVGKYVYWPGSGFRFSEPDLLEIGDYVVFGSRSLLYTSDSTHRRQKIKLEAGSNVSDRCVVLPGTTVKCGAVLGSGALTKQGGTYNPGTYVGSRNNDCVVLKKASVADTGVSSSYANAFMGRGRIPYLVLPESAHILWSTFCICVAAVTSRLPLVLALLVMGLHCRENWYSYSIYEILAWAVLYVLCMYPVVLMAVLGIDLASKWLIIGLRVPGSHSWDTTDYNQRWQLYLSIAPIRSFASGEHDFLDFFLGSQYLVWYYRALGAKIGKQVCLYPNGADPKMTEPELVTIRDGACIDDASLIAHLNTKGVFTLNHLLVGERAVMRTSSRLQQSAVMERRSVLLEHTLVLPADTVKTNEWRQGWPAGRGVMDDDDEEEVGETRKGGINETHSLLWCA